MTTGTRALVACGGLLAAFAAGRYSARQPDTIVDERAVEARQETETVEEEAAVDASSSTQETQAATVQATTERVRVRIVEREVRADGSSSEREIELDAETARLAVELQASRAEVAQLQAAAARAEARESAASRTEERRVEVRTPLPDWRVGGLVGWDGGLAYGAEVQRRILGPVYVGAWGLSSGSLGVGVGVEFGP